MAVARRPHPASLSPAPRRGACRDPATGRPLTDEQLAGEVGLMFFAGFETTGHTMAWALFLLASHPQAAARVAAELDEHGLLVMPRRPRPRQLEYADLSKLK